MLKPIPAKRYNQEKNTENELINCQSKYNKQFKITNWA